MLKSEGLRELFKVRVNQQWFVTAASSIQVEIYRDGRRYFHWLAVEYVGSVPPFVDSLLRRATKARVALHHMHALHRTLLRDKSLHHHIPFDAVLLRSLRIGGNPLHEEILIHHVRVHLDRAGSLDAGYCVGRRLVGRDECAI